MKHPGNCETETLKNCMFKLKCENSKRSGKSDFQASELSRFQTAALWNYSCFFSSGMKGFNILPGRVRVFIMILMSPVPMSAGFI